MVGQKDNRWVIALFGEAQHIHGERRVTRIPFIRDNGQRSCRPMRATAWSIRPSQFVG